MKAPTGSASLIALLTTFLAAVLGQTAAPPRPRVDWLGDPLPPGAVVRIGTERMRTTAHCSVVGFTPDGKAVITTIGGQGTVFWDVKTGKIVRRLRGGPWEHCGQFLSRDGKILGGRNHQGIVAVDTATGATLQVFPRPKTIPQYASYRGICAVILAPDGKSLAVGWADKTVRLYDVRTGKERHVWRGLSCFPRCVLFTPDSSCVVAGEEESKESISTIDKDINRHLFVWDARTGKLRHKMAGLTKPICSLAVSPDGRWLVSVTLDGDVRTWDLTAGKRTAGLGERRVVGSSVRFSPDGRLLAVCDSSAVHLYSWPGGKPVRTLKGFGSYLVAFSPDGRTIAGTGPGSRSIHLWDVATGEKRFVPAGTSGILSHATLSPDGRVLAALSQDGSVRLWDVATGRPLRVAGSYKGVLHVMSFSPDSRSLVWAETATGKDGRDWHWLVAWDLSTGHRKRWNLDYLVPQHINFSPDGRLLVLAPPYYRQSPELHFWDRDKGEVVSVLPGQDRHLDTAVFAPDGRTLAVVPHPAKGSLQAQVELWDMKAGKRQTTFKGEPVTPMPPTRRGMKSSASPWLVGLTFSADSRLLMAGGNGRLYFWDTAAGSLWRTWRYPQGATTSALSPDGKLVAFAVEGEADTVRVWEVATGQEVLRFVGHPAEWNRPIRPLAFVGDGRRLLSVSEADGIALVWDLLASANAGASSRKTEVTLQQEELLWQELDGPGATGFRAMQCLVRAPAEGLALLRARLKPAPAYDLRRVKRLIKDLDADSAAVRDRATRELEAMGELAETELQRALANKPSAEVKRRLHRLLAGMTPPKLPPGRLRHLRAVLALEWMGTVEARNLLRSLAAGASHAPLTLDARAALYRLKVRNKSR